MEREIRRADEHARATDARPRRQGPGPDDIRAACDAVLRAKARLDAALHLVDVHRTTLSSPAYKAMVRQDAIDAAAAWDRAMTELADLELRWGSDVVRRHMEAAEAAAEVRRRREDEYFAAESARQSGIRDTFAPPPGEDPIWDGAYEIVERNAKASPVVARHQRVIARERFQRASWRAAVAHAARRPVCRQHSRPRSRSVAASRPTVAGDSGDEPPEPPPGRRRAAIGGAP
jgi:hypothetical protein